jgi:hypothetical protein
MGFLGNLFGKGNDLPALEPGSVAASRLEPFRPELEKFLGKVNDRLELVPAENSLYAFIGKPPGAFGMIWWQDGGEHSLKTLMQERALSQVRVQRLSDELRDSYKRHMGDERFAATVGGKQVVVTPSDALAADVEKIIQTVD